MQLYAYSMQSRLLKQFFLKNNIDEIGIARDVSIMTQKAYMGRQYSGISLRWYQCGLMWSSNM